MDGVAPAARALAKEVFVIGPKGKEFEDASIGNALASRELSQQLREMGVETGGPAPMSRKDKSRFLGKLDEVVNRVHRLFPPEVQVSGLPQP